MELHDDILETLGETPLVRLGRFCRSGAVLAAKIESFNPAGSVKDRIGLAMIEAAEERGELEPGQATWGGIRAWLMANPERAAEIFAVNARYIFFRELEIAELR